MAEPSYTPVPACPRCACNDTAIVARSPIAGVWTMFLCHTCFYGWRSTEPEYATSRAAMAPGFHVDPSSIPNGKVMPELPPLRRP